MGQAGFEKDREACAGRGETDQDAAAQSFQRRSPRALGERRTMQRLECEDGMPPACMQAVTVNSPVANHLVKICTEEKIAEMRS